MKRIILTAICFALVINCLAQPVETGPNEYILSLFTDHDYVFLGEIHRVSHDANFVSSMIPDLYKKGVTNLGYEFCEFTTQSLVDSMVTAVNWNEDLMYKIASTGFYLTWGYREYLNIFHEVWKLNQSLGANEKKFRIVCLGPEFIPCKQGLERFGGKDPDRQMADIFIAEVINRNEKALIYCGIHHAFTRYHQPIYDFSKGELIGFNKSRMGNIICNRYPDVTATVFLHSPWISIKGFDKPFVRPANGSIDSLMVRSGNRPAGFDLKGSPAGKFKATDTYYALGYPDFKLEDFCDGYVFLRPYGDFRNVEVDKQFYTPENTERFREFLLCQGWPKEKVEKITPELVIMLMSEDGNIENRVSHLK